MEENRYKCYLCSNEITSLNKTDEHIILNAIGGRLRSSTIICNDCNNKMGETSDSILAEDLSFFSDMLQIKRERSSSHNQIMIDEEGDEVIVDDAGLKFNLRKPSIKIKEIDGEKKMRIVAKNEQQIKGMLNRAVKEGNINQDQADSAFSKAKKENYRPILKKEIFISNGAFPSIIKSAVNFYVDRTHDMETIEHLVPVIKGEKSTEGVIYLYIFKMLPYSTCDKQVTHMIHIEGSKSTRFLYALMEYFSVYTYIVILHDDYEGENINMTYTYDVISNKEVNRKFSCPLKKGDIDTLKSIPHDQYCKEYLPEYRKRIDSIMEIWQERCSTYELQKLLKNVFSKYQENCLIDEQMLKQIKDVIMDFVIQKIDDTNADCNEHKR